MGCGCKKSNPRKQRQVTRENVQKKEQQILKLKTSIREQLNTFKRLTNQ